MVWEFRKRMVRVGGVKETTLHVNSFNALKNRPVYDVPAGYGRIEDFRLILEKEVAVIVDEQRRGAERAPGQ
ncbi:hypothetical protein HGB07_07525 [Candidatus Roizmanbacteria bacterium]|nr:hypothetical protein [Candidatus Roizmanbacteria bacterium]